MKHAQVAPEVRLIEEFVEAVGCPREVRDNIGSAFRRHRRWAIKRLAERLETMLGDALPSDEEVMRAAVRKLSAARRTR